MARKPFVAGNWKMHYGRGETRSVLEALKASVGMMSQVDVAIAPPFTALQTAVEVTRGSSVKIAAQNMHHAEKGAYTGEISPSMLADVGAHYVILGHSERRSLFGETDAGVCAKVKAALGAGLEAIVCIGETLEEREASRTLAVVRGQVIGALEGVDEAAMASITLAYEPVWAIGTGKTATPVQAQEVHKALRGLLEELYSLDTAQAVRILYGGSVKPHNAAELFGQEDIDGGLVGGASLKADSFAAIVNAARTA